MKCIELFCYFQFCLWETVQVQYATTRDKSGPALGGTEYRLMPSACRLIVRAKFTISIPRESCTNAKYSSSVVPPDPSVHFYHWPLLLPFYDHYTGLPALAGIPWWGIGVFCQSKVFLLTCHYDGNWCIRIAEKLVFLSSVICTVCIPYIWYLL